MASGVSLVGIFLIGLMLGGVIAAQLIVDAKADVALQTLTVLEERRDALTAEQQLLLRRRSELEMRLAAEIATAEARRSALGAAVAASEDGPVASDAASAIAEIRARNEARLALARERLSTVQRMASSASLSAPQPSGAPRPVTAAS